jgi:hypothetical protein
VGRSRSRRVSLPGVAELSAAELLELERARLALRAYGITVDRGRLVREAIAVLLADLDAEGEASLLAGRLRDMTSGGG